MNKNLLFPTIERFVLTSHSKDILHRKRLLGRAHIIKKLRALLLSAVYVSFLFIVPAVVMAGAKEAVIDGSFITADQCGFWTDAQWQQEFASIQSAGMHYIIILPAAETSIGKATKTIYPSTLPNTEMDKVGGVVLPDVIDACLRNAESAGVKIFIGIDIDNKWWGTGVDDSTWFYGQMNFDNRVCDELWNLYKKKYSNAFYGWYWVYEVNNIQIVTEVQQKVLINAVNMQLDHLISTNEKLPFMLCPFMVSSFGSPQAYQGMWQNVFAGLHTAPGDIFCPQDCVGARGLNINEVDAWFSALRRAVDTKPGLVMWSDVETFDLSDYTSATIGRVVSQMKLEQPYVENFITWDYCYYDSPIKVDSGYQAAYMKYLKTGSLEGPLPAAPTNFTAVLQTNGDVALNWNASKDSAGVCGYYVYRNGEIVFKNQIPRVREGGNDQSSFWSEVWGFLKGLFTGSKKANPSLTSATDVCLHSNTDYTYQVRAYDFAGNVSPSTPSITINTGKIAYLPNVVSAGCPYTVSIPSCTDTSGTKNTKLTDGIYADSATIKDPRWEGFHDNYQKARDVVIDLGKTMPVQQFVANYLFDYKAMVFLPEKVTILVSTDNINFKEVGDFTRPNVSWFAPAASYKYRFTRPEPVDARYVDFRTVPRAMTFDEFTYCDELEVRSNLLTSEK